MSCCIEESQEQPTQAPADARPGTSTLQPLALFLAVQAEAKLQPPAGLLPQADRPAALVPDQCPRYQRFCALLI